MKKLKLFFALSFVAVMSATTAMAQSAETTMNVTAELLSGLQITNVQAPKLGKFILTSQATSINNSFIISTDPLTPVSPPPEIAAVESPQTGFFGVSGSSDTQVNVTISESVDLTHATNNTAKFTLTTAVDVPGSSSFTSNGGNLTGVVLLNTNGESNPIYVGGTLGGIDQADEPGIYTGTINITVAY
jgi:hypothetical protein